MQFYDVWTNYKEFGKKYGYARNPLRFYDEVLKEYGKLDMGEIEYLKFPFIRFTHYMNMVAEQNWYKNHMPYYKVWPGIFDTFIKTRIDIKTKLLNFSHNTFAIRLPIIDEPILTFNYMGNKAWVESIIIQGMKINDDYTRFSMKVIYRADNKEYSCPGTFNKALIMENNKTIEEEFGTEEIVEKDYNDKEYIIPSSIVDSCCRLSVAVCFLSTGSHKVLEYDVLSKHLQKYRELEDNNKKKLYEQKAKEKGKFGWNIGVGRGDRNLKLPRGVSYEQAYKDAGGRELLYQHIRGGHWHTVKYGKDKKETKVVWFEDTVVRKDLPPKPLNV